MLQLKILVALILGVLFLVASYYVVIAITIILVAYFTSKLLANIKEAWDGPKT